MTRRGFALIAVVWVIAIVSVLALGATLSARETVAAVRNRTALTRAAWLGEGCVALSRALVDSVLVDATAWSRLDQLRLPGRVRACDVTLEPAGMRLDVNGADEETLRRLIGSDSLAQAVLDWRDADDVPRPLGAEREWYVAMGGFPPRNGPLADLAELRRVRGFASLAGFDTLLAFQPGRIALNHASAAVLAALPGFTPELVGRVVERRARGERLPSLAALAEGLSPMARDSLLTRRGDLVAAATVEPDAWVLTVIAPAGGSSLVAAIELRLAFGGNRAAVVRRREW